MRKLVSMYRGALIVLLTSLALMAQNVQDVPQKISALENQAQKLLQEQKPQLAIPVLREIISLDPKNLNAQANLGVLLFFQNNYAEAITHMRAAFEMQPDLWRVEALLGIAEKRTGQSDAALTDLERAFPNLDDKKIRLEAGLELIEIQSASGRLDKAVMLASKLLELAPQNPQVFLVTYEISRQMTYQSLLGMMMVAPDSAEMHMIMAGELGRQGDHTNSIAQYREAIRLNPKLPGVHFELAEQLRASSDATLNAQAEGEYRAALRVNQFDAGSWRQLGGIMTANGNFREARDDYKKALTIQPNDSDAKTGLAIALVSMNQTNEAISLLENAAKDDPTNIVAHYRLSQLYRRVGRSEDAQRETDAFNHYKDVKERLGKVFKQLAGPANPL